MDLVCHTSLTRMKKMRGRCNWELGVWNTLFPPGPGGGEEGLMEWSGVSFLLLFNSLVVLSSPMRGSVVYLCFDN